MYALTGRLYDSAKQYRRAAHYYKLQIMSNAGGTHSPDEVSALMCLAAAYDWDSLVTGQLVGMFVAAARQHRLLNMWLCIPHFLAQLLHHVFSGVSAAPSA